jgi:hypothetical protein
MRRLQQLNSAVGLVEDVPHEGRLVRAAPGDEGPMIFGPYVPMPAGDWVVGFDIALGDGAVAGRDDVVATLEAITAAGTRRLGHAEVRGGELMQGPNWRRHSVRFSLEQTTMGVEFRLTTLGRVALRAKFAVDVLPATAVGTAITPEPAWAALRYKLPLPVRKVLGRVRRRLNL